MYEIEYPHLFTPIRIGSVEAKNRIFSAPIGFMANLDCTPNMEMADYYERKAMGGAALVTVGEASVDSVHGKCAPFEINLDQGAKTVAFLYKVAGAIKKHGALANCELMHPGWIATASAMMGQDIYSPVEFEVKGQTVGATGEAIVAKAMTEAEIEATIQKFIDSAMNAKAAGFDMVLVHGGHGWLLAQFMSPKFNTRTDGWGGSLENCMRFPIEVCKGIKAACGQDFPIEFRMSADECTPHGYGLDDGVEMAKMIAPYVDMLHVSAGFHEDQKAFHDMCPSMFHADECNLIYAEEVKKHVEIPVSTVGTHNDPARMEAIIAGGKADIISCARALMADPDMPLKAHAGKADEVKQCLRCYICFSSVLNTMRYKCAINPEIGNENESKYPPIASPKKVLVAGGGIAGMAAALDAAKFGHEVILCEKDDELGGILRCEADVPFKKRLDLYIETQKRLIERNPSIEVRTGTPVTKELAREIAPDALIAALGARPVVPTFIPGYDGVNVCSAEEVYYDPSKAGERAVILGGGLVGTELAIYLSMLGKKVTVLEMLPALNFGENILQGRAIGIEIEKYGIEVVTGTKAKEITAEGVVGEGAEGDRFFEAGTVIYAMGQRALKDEVDEIRFCAPEFYAIGDIVKPANICQATTTARYAARNIGRV